MFHRTLNWTCPQWNWLTSHPNQLFSQGPFISVNEITPSVIQTGNHLWLLSSPSPCKQNPVSSAPPLLLNLSAICISSVATPGSENPHPWPDIHQFLPGRLFPVLSLLPFLPTHFLIYKSGYTTVQLNSLKWLLVAVRIKSIFLLGQ